MPRVHQAGVRGVDTGMHYTFFGGRITVGPDWRPLCASALILLAPSAAFFVFVAPYVGSHMSWALVAVSGALVAFVFAMLAATAFRDPGYFPRSPPDTDVEYGLRPPTKDYAINGYTVTTKYCATCCHYRPPRTSHCAVCDNCVDRFDHHCPWVGTCVGRRNYRAFLSFVLSATALCLWVLALCVAQLAHAARARGGGWGAAVGAHPASLVLAVYVFAFAWFVGGLSAFHLWLVARNTTTYEHFRHRYLDAGNPYSRGLRRNCWEVFCAPAPPRHGPLGAKQREEAAAAAGGVPAGTLTRGEPGAALGDDGSSHNGSYEGGNGSASDFGHLGRASPGHDLDELEMMPQGEAMAPEGPALQVHTPQRQQWQQRPSEEALQSPGPARAAAP